MISTNPREVKTHSPSQRNLLAALRQDAVAVFERYGVYDLPTLLQAIYNEWMPLHLRVQAKETLSPEDDAKEQLLHNDLFTLAMLQVFSIANIHKRMHPGVDVFQEITDIYEWLITAHPNRDGSSTIPIEVMIERYDPTHGSGRLLYQWLGQGTDLYMGGLEKRGTTFDADRWLREVESLDAPIVGATTDEGEVSLGESMESVFDFRRDYTKGFSFSQKKVLSVLLDLYKKGRLGASPRSNFTSWYYFRMFSPVFDEYLDEEVELLTMLGYTKEAAIFHLTRALRPETAETERLNFRDHVVGIKGGKGGVGQTQFYATIKKTRALFVEAVKKAYARSREEFLERRRPW